MTNKHPQLSTLPMIDLYSQGLSGDQIGKMFGIKKSSVIRRLKKAGVVIRLSKDYSGKNRYWRWKGEDYFTPVIRKYNQLRLRKWSLAVRTRDQHACQDCGKTNGRLHAHHIVVIQECMNTELEFDIRNGVTLCPKCHGRRHRDMRRT